MKHSGNLVFCLAGGLILHLQARAVTSDSSANPYSSIVERNVFGLRPPPPPAVEAPKPVNVPAITLQGIISAFGKKQVLFKTMMSARAGEAPKETSLIMSEGERIDEIAVLEIDEIAGTIKFDNHGTEQIKDLAKDGVKQSANIAAAPASLPGVALPRLPVVPATTVLPQVTGGSSVTTFGGNVGNANIPGRPMRMTPATSGVATGVPTANAATPPERPLTREEQTVLIEVNRKLTEDKVRNGELPPLPPTELTPPQ